MPFVPSLVRLGEVLTERGWLVLPFHPHDVGSVFAFRALEPAGASPWSPVECEMSAKLRKRRGIELEKVGE